MIYHVIYSRSQQMFEWFTVSFAVSADTMGNHTAKLGTHLSNVKSRVAETVRQLMHKDLLQSDVGSYNASDTIVPDGLSVLDLSTTDIDCDDDFQAYLELHTEPASVYGLVLMGNIQVTTVPTHIAVFSNLLELNLSDNCIDNVSLSIIQLTNLQKLDLSRNRLTELPKSICSLKNLQILLLRENCLVYLPTELLNLEQLRILDVTHNNSLISPKLSQCLRGVEYIKVIMSNRLLPRQNVWQNAPSYFKKPCVDTLLELCAQSIVDKHVGFLDAEFIPPVIKNYLSNVVKESEQTVRVAKCNTCHGVFSNKFNFSIHCCKS